MPHVTRQNLISKTKPSKWEYDLWARIHFEKTAQDRDVKLKGIWTKTEIELNFNLNRNE